MYLIMDSLKAVCLGGCTIAMVAEVRPVIDRVEQSDGIIRDLLLCIRKGAANRYGY